MRKMLSAFFVLTLALGLASSGWGQSQITSGTVQGMFSMRRAGASRVQPSRPRILIRISRKRKQPARTAILHS